MLYRIVIVGSGYVGQISAAGFAHLGHRVSGLDIDPITVESLNNGRSPIYEPNLERYLQDGINSKRLSFTTDAEVAMRDADAVFFAVGTPSLPNGAPDKTALVAAIDSIVSRIKKYTAIIIKSTVPVGTSLWVESYINERHGISSDMIDVIANPEFLREGNAIYDFFHPNMIVIGSMDKAERARAVLRDIYRPFEEEGISLLWSNLPTAELIKYSCNVSLATSITLINQIANLSEKTGADISAISDALRLLYRDRTMRPGPGYGGSCLPKDMRALINSADRHGVDLGLLRAVSHANLQQKERVARNIAMTLGSLKNKKIAVLGIEFKENTDDTRESSAIHIVERLLLEGGNVAVHGYRGQSNFQATMRSRLPWGSNIIYSDTPRDAFQDADATVILCDWPGYRQLDLNEMRAAMRGNLLVDPRNIFASKKDALVGFNYQGAGK